VSKDAAKRSAFRRNRPNMRVAQTEKQAEILLYDEIGWFGIRADDFKRELDAVTAPDITLRINSPGGDVFDSLAIYNAIRAHPATVTTHVDGIAASMASVIALAGDKVVMADNAFMMIHHPWSIVLGNAADMRKEADVLDKVSGSLLSAYAEKTGRDGEELSALMDDETWFTAAEAVAFGIADEVFAEEEKQETAPLAALFDLSIFANVPKSLREQDDLGDPTIRDLERALRDAGLSQIAAKQYVAAGRTAASQRDVEEAGERDAPRELEQPHVTHYPYR
jgi:ATP-dependent Clp protease, protease subunit